MLSDLPAMSSLLANSSTSKALKGSLNLQEKVAIWEYRVKGGEILVTYKCHLNEEFIDHESLRSQVTK